MFNENHASGKLATTHAMASAPAAAARCNMKMPAKNKKNYMHRRKNQRSLQTSYINNLESSKPKEKLNEKKKKKKRRS